MKYLYGKPNPDETMEVLCNPLFDLFVLLGRYADYCSQNNYKRFELYMMENVHQQKQRDWLSFRHGYQFVRDVIIQSPKPAISGIMLRRLACNHRLEIKRLPSCTPDILKCVFTYIFSMEKYSGWHTYLQSSLYRLCDRCSKNDFVEKSIMCADRTLGFQMDLINEKIENGCRKAIVIKEKIENQFRLNQVVEKCDLGGARDARE